MTYAGWVLGAGRAAAEALHVDTCLVTRVTGEEGPMDPETGLPTPGATTDIYGPDIAPHQGRCKVQTYEPHESARASSEHTYTEQRYHLHVPISAPLIKVGDTVEVVASMADPQLVGRTYRVAGEHAKSLATARRLLIDEVVD